MKLHTTIRESEEEGGGKERNDVDDIRRRVQILQKREKAERRSVFREPDRHRKTDRIASVATFVVVVCLHWLPRAPDCLTKADNLINSSLEPNGTNSLQLFVVEFDTYLVWELLLLPSNAQTAPN